MFEDYPRETITKDGTLVLMRPAVKEDADRLLAFFNRIPEQERWFLREDLCDPGVFQNWIKDLDYNRILPMVAVRESDGRIIANVRIYRRPAPCMRHVGHLRIGVDPEYRHQRLGTWMFVDSIKLAMDIGIEKLVAEFVSGVEDAAMNGVKKLDFFREAVLSDYIRDPEGNYRDLIIMVKNLHRDWSDF